MNYFKLTLISLLICVVFPLTSIADQLEDANTAINNEDYTKASELLKPLAEEGNIEALANLGALYVNGQGVEQDFNKGLSMIMKAAKKGYKPARIMAYKLCIDLGNQGDPAAMFNVGYMCLNGWGGEHDTNVCLKWLETAGKMGHEKSSNILSKIYTKGMFGVAPDKEKAAYWNNLEASFEAGVDGEWESSVPGMDGKPMKYTYDFKTDGDKLTGTTVGYGGREMEIEDGKIDGNNISFKTVTRNMGMKTTSKYTGLFLGDTLKLSLITNMGNGDSPPMTFDAKRAE